jgi:hypothetical protein
LHCTASISIFTSFNQSDKLRILLFFFPVFLFPEKNSQTQQLIGQCRDLFEGYLVPIIVAQEQKSAKQLTAADKDALLLSECVVPHLYNNGTVATIERQHQRVGCSQRHCNCIAAGFTGAGFQGKGINRGNRCWSSMFGLLL